MVVKMVCPREQRYKVVSSYVHTDTESNGGPEGVPPADPIPERKHVVLVDTKCCHLNIHIYIYSLRPKVFEQAEFRATSGS